MRTKCILKVLVVAVFILGGTLFSAADPLTVMEPVTRGRFCDHFLS